MRFKTRYTQSKYHNQKVSLDGYKFDSEKEAARYCQLKLLLRAGKISNLQLQKEYELIPAQYVKVPTNEFYTRGERKGERKTKSVCVEKAVKYFADFVYTENGKTVVEDTKGVRTDTYKIKRKLMLYRYGIKIKEL